MNVAHVVYWLTGVDVGGLEDEYDDVLHTDCDVSHLLCKRGVVDQRADERPDQFCHVAEAEAPTEQEQGGSRVKQKLVNFVLFVIVLRPSNT